MTDTPKMMYAFEDFLTPGMYYYLSEDREYVERMMALCKGGITDDFHYGQDRLRLVEIHPKSLEHLDKDQFSKPHPEDYTNDSKRDYQYWVSMGKQVRRPMA